MENNVLKAIDAHILKQIHQYELIQRDDRVVVAVSGGPDSMMLLHWLWLHRHVLRIELCAAHLNHQFRGGEAEADALYVEKMCAKWGLHCFTESKDVAQYAQENHLSKQVAARECRYQFFDDLCQSQGYNKVAIAHHADDQVETMVLRLVRGAGLQGLSGIPPYRETENYTVIRPLLALSRQQIEAYCQYYELEPRLDKSNLNDDYDRNYMRLHVIPLLKKMNPSLHDGLAETSELLREENEYIQHEAQQYVSNIIYSRQNKQTIVKIDELNKIPLPLQRRLILIILNYLCIERAHWSKIHIDAILELISVKKGYKQVMLPYDVIVSRDYDLLLIEQKGQRHSDSQNGGDGLPLLRPSFPSSYEYEFQGEGEHHFDDIGIHISLRTVDEQIDIIHNSNSYNDRNRHGCLQHWPQVYTLVFDEHMLKYPFIIRNRRPGDKIQPLGMDGHKKVKDIFIDEKISQLKRAMWPIVTDQEDIIWIPGLKYSAKVQRTPQRSNKKMMILTMNWEGFS